MTTTTVRRWLREPLVQFLLIGLLLFIGDRGLNSGPDPRGNSARIELTEGDLGQLDVAWMAQWRRHPTAEERRNLVTARVREEILYREALALGLDKDDTIVKRRLAQKMEFLTEDAPAVREPTHDELKAWFEKNRDRFALPARASFRHVYFSFDRGGDRARDDAARAHEKLAGKRADSATAAQVGDPFMFQDYYGDRTPQQVASVFGGKFAEALFRLTLRSWQGPIESGFGWHVVWVDSMTPARVPDFEEVEAEVKAERIAEQRAEAKLKAFDAMKARYQIVLPGPNGRP